LFKNVDWKKLEYSLLTYIFGTVALTFFFLYLGCSLELKYGLGIIAFTLLYLFALGFKTNYMVNKSLRGDKNR